MSGHKGPAIEMPFDPAQEWSARETRLWPGRRGYPVAGRLNGTAFRSAIVGRMGRLFVLVDERLARKVGLALGQSVEVVLWPEQGDRGLATTGGSRALSTAGRPGVAKQGK